MGHISSGTTSVTIVICALHYTVDVECAHHISTPHLLCIHDIPVLILRSYIHHTHTFMHICTVHSATANMDSHITFSRLHSSLTHARKHAFTEFTHSLQNAVCVWNTKLDTSNITLFSSQFPPPARRNHDGYHMFNRRLFNGEHSSGCRKLHAGEKFVCSFLFCFLLPFFFLVEVQFVNYINMGIHMSKPKSWGQK